MSKLSKVERLVNLTKEEINIIKQQFTLQNQMRNDILAHIDNIKNEIRAEKLIHDAHAAHDFASYYKFIDAKKAAKEKELIEIDAILEDIRQKLEEKLIQQKRYEEIVKKEHHKLAEEILKSEIDALDEIAKTLARK